jgi:hypothetical protein
MELGERRVEVNGVALCVETFGDRGDPAVLLVMGAGASMLSWEDEFCERLAAAASSSATTTGTPVAPSPTSRALPSTRATISSPMRQA